MNNENEILLRPIELADLGAIFEIDKSLARGERDIALTELVSENLGEVLDLSLVAETSGRVVGFGLAQRGYIGDPEVEVGLIQGLGVHPLYQRQGIARRLLNALTERLQSKGIKALRVMLNERDNQIEGFFMRMDFHRTPMVVCDKFLETRATSLK